MDGTVAMQSPIEPRSTFTYSFRLKDAGLYWFHPHIRSDRQIEKGLYGVVRVSGAGEPLVDDERIVVLDDVRLAADDGALATGSEPDDGIIGRQGDLLLVNGRTAPVLAVRAGSLVRLRILNAATARFFNLSLPGHTFRIVGTDGGAIPVPYDVERLLVAPGERYDTLLIPYGAPGDEIPLMDEPYDRGHDTGDEPPAPVATVRIQNGAQLERFMPHPSATLERLSQPRLKDVIRFDEVEASGAPIFTVNGAAYPDVPPIEVEDGALRELEIQNQSSLDHPFHLHGFFFQVLATNGIPAPDAALANKDTINVPRKTTLALATRFDEPGRWMYHCHILEHAEHGMMGEIVVKP